MSDLNDLLRRDGARWREEVDRRFASDPLFELDPLFDRVTSRAAVGTSVRGLRTRFAGRAPLLLSVAAVTVAAFAVAAGIVLAPDSRDTHPTPPALGDSATSAAVSISSSAPSTSAARSSTAAAPRAHRSTAAHRVGPGAAAPVTSSAAARHKKRHPHPVAVSTSSSARPLACESANLGLSISAPAPAGDHATLTVSVVNNGTAPCTISGFPAVQFTADSAVSATPTADTPTLLTLANGAMATAEVDWDGTSATGTCPTYATTFVSTPGASAVQFPLDPPAVVCDASTLVTHPLTAG